MHVKLPLKSQAPKPGRDSAVRNTTASVLFSLCSSLKMIFKLFTQTNCSQHVESITVITWISLEYILHLRVWVWKNNNTRTTPGLIIYMPLIQVVWFEMFKVALPQNDKCSKSYEHRKWLSACMSLLNHKLFI